MRMSPLILWGCLSVLAGLIAMVPTSIMLSKETKPERVQFNHAGHVTTYLVCDLAWPRRAILGNTVAIIILMLTIYKANETLMKTQIGLIIIAGIGLIWSFYYCYKYYIAGMRAAEEADEKSDSTDAFCAFQAQVREVQTEQDRLLLENVYVWVAGGWFPYSYPCSYIEDAPLPLYNIKKFADQTIHKGDCISFSAIARLEGKQKTLAFSLHQCFDLEVIPKLVEMPDTPERKQHLNDVWHQAERLVCKTCVYASGCRNRKLPCVVVAAEKGRWNRAFLTEQYPQLIENELSKEVDATDSTGYFDFIVVWYAKEDIKELGYKTDCAVILGALDDAPVEAGCRICKLDGEEIRSADQIIQILKRHKAGDKLSILTQLFDKDPVQSTITLVDQRRAATVVFDWMPFAGKDNDSWIQKK